MTKKIVYISTFVLIAIAIAILLKPTDDELVYVYEKAEKREKLKEKYDVLVEQNPENKKLQEKQLENLEKLNDDEYIVRLINFYKKNKTKENINKIIVYYKANEDYDSIIKWYIKDYERFDEISSIEELIKLASFTNNKELQIKYLKEKYAKTKEQSVLFDLYNIGEYEYAFDNLKKIALKTKDKQLIFTLYGLNEKKFALDNLKKLALKNKLKAPEYTKTIELLIYEKRFKDSLELYKRKKLKDLDIVKNVGHYEYLFKKLKNDTELKKLYKYAYEATSDEKYFNDVVNLHLNDVDITTSIGLFKTKYDKTDDLKYLEDIIYLYYTDDNQEEYLKHLELKALKTKDIITLKFIIAEYLDNDNIDLVNKLLKKVKNLTAEYDEFDELYLLTLVHTNQKEKAKKEFAKYKPENPSANVIYSIFDQKINKTSMPYFMKILKDSRDEDTKSKLFRYRYKIAKLFTPETYEAFGKPNTFKKLARYTHLLERKEKNKVYQKFTKESDDPMFLADIGFYFLSVGDYNKAQKPLEKAYKINPKNLFVLDYLAQVYAAKRDYDKSLVLLNSYNELKPNDPIINYRIGELLYAKDDIDESEKFYNATIKHTKIEDVEDKALVLKSKARLGTTLEELKKEYEDVILESNYNNSIINEYISLYIEERKYSEALKLIKRYKTYNDSREFKSIEITTLSGLKRYKEAKKEINEKLKLEENKENVILHEQLGFINLAGNEKKSAIKAFDKSIKLGSKNEEVVAINEDLKKEYRHSIGVKAGVRNKINEVQVKASYIHNNLFKMSAQNDTYEKYNSTKVIVEDLNDKYILGVGKDYIKIGDKNIYNNLFNSTKLSLFFEKSIDIGTKKTIEDELIHDRYNVTFASSIEEIIFYNVSLDYYNYDDFKRKRVTASIYYPFAKDYFATLSYVYEKVEDKLNASKYGYDNINAPSVVFGKNQKVNNNFSYLASLGAEFKDGKVNALSNLDFKYRNKDMDLSWNNGFSRDDITDEYTFTSLFYYTHFY